MGRLKKKAQTTKNIGKVLTNMFVQRKEWKPLRLFIVFNIKTCENNKTNRNVTVSILVVDKNIMFITYSVFSVFCFDNPYVSTGF